MKTTRKSTYVRVMVEITMYNERQDGIKHELDFVTIGFDNTNKENAIMKATMFCEDLDNVNFVLDNKYKGALRVEPIKISKITIKQEQL